MFTMYGSGNVLTPLRRYSLITDIADIDSIHDRDCNFLDIYPDLCASQEKESSQWICQSDRYGSRMNHAIFPRYRRERYPFQTDQDRCLYLHLYPLV